MKPLVCAVIAQFRNVPDTLNCVDSIERNGYDPVRLFVVDDCSGEGCFEQLRNSLPRHTVISTDHNGGYAFALNLGIRRALESEADYILLLNNDTVLRPGSIGRLLASFSRFPRAGAAGPKVLIDDGRTIGFAGGSIELARFVTIHRGAGGPDKGQYDREEKTGFLSGCCLMVKRPALEVVGLLDESFFMFFEDTDFCLRLRKTHFDLIYNPEAVVLHKGAASMGGKKSAFALEWWMRSRRRFMRKYRQEVPVMFYSLSVVYYWITRLGYAVFYSVTGRFRLSAAVLRALVNP